MRGNIRFKGPSWCASRFQVHFERDQIRGVLYAGVTIFGLSVIYSDHW